MFVGSFAGHEDVINVGIAEGKPSQHLVYETLKGLRSVFESEWHAQKFK